MRDYMYVLLHCLCILSASALTSTPVLQATDKYIETGTYSVTTTSSTTMNSNNIKYYGLNYSIARPYNMTISTSIQSITYATSSTQPLLNIKVGQCSSGVTGFNFELCLYSTQLHKVSIIDIRYIALDLRFTKLKYHPINISPNSTTNPFSLSKNSQKIVFYPFPSISAAGIVKTFAVISGFNINIPNNGCFQLRVDSSYSSSKLQVELRSECSNIDPIKVYSISLVVTSYNQVEIAQQPFPAAVILNGEAKAPDPYTNSNMFSYNTFWGLFRIELQSANVEFQWKSAFTSSRITSGSTKPYKDLRFSVMIFLFKECKSPTLYYLSQKDLCYDVCPERYYENTTYSVCTACPQYDCYTCGNNQSTESNCLSCSSSIDFRIQNGTRCVPMDGYYDNGTSISTAQLCNLTLCRTCSKVNFNCTACNDGFILSANTCTPLSCASNCSNCTSATNCLSCQAGYINLVTSCLQCTMILHCVSCSTFSCSLCDPYYGIFNATTCKPVCGDGHLMPEQSCDDGGIINGDGCSSTCTFETGFYCVPEGIKSKCTACMLNCLQCTNTTFCNTCQGNLTFNTVMKRCIMNCPSIPSCINCTLSNNLNVCLECSTGYILSLTNDSCGPICGDGMIVASEACDDHNKVDGDGCSSSCTIEETYFCINNVSSICSLCDKGCNSCVAKGNCSICNNFTTMAIGICQPICTSISSECSSCSLATWTTIICTNCTIAFGLVGNNCSSVCGNGYLTLGEQCDDGNNNNGDGCSSLCVIEPAFYCPTVNNTCLPCLKYCLSCTNDTNCLNCSSSSTFNGSSCVIQCPVNSTCLTCTFSSSRSIVCDTCPPNYALNGAQECVSVCGDGFTLSGQECDDNNTYSGDGCSSECGVEAYFVCNQTSASGYSLCFLIEMNLNKVSIIKDPQSNQATITLQPIPSGLSFYSTANWKSIIESPSQSVAIKSVTYQPQTNTLKIQIEYFQDIESTNVDFMVSLSNSPAELKYVQGQTLGVAMVSDDNQALSVYTKETYSLASIVKYMSYGIGIIGLLISFMSLVGGRIIGLETVAVIQITFFSLITLDKMSPTVAALSGLGLSAGYNRLKAYDLSQKIQAPFKAIQWEANFIFNFNIMSLFIVIPLLVSLVAKILIKCKVEKHLRFIMMVQMRSLFQYTLYGYLVNAYNINISLIVSMLFFGVTKEMISQLLGVLFGVVFLIFGAIMTYFFVKEREYFGQFKNKFTAEPFSQVFYLIYAIERLLNSIIIVTLFNIPFQNAAIMLIFAVIFFLIYKNQPYFGKRSNIRPLINQITTFSIQTIYLLTGILNNPKGIISIYGPLAILALLLTTVTLNTIYLIKGMIKSIKEMAVDLQHQKKYTDKDIQNMQFEQLKLTLFKSTQGRILQSVNRVMATMQKDAMSKQWDRYDELSYKEEPRGLNEVKNQINLSDRALKQLSPHQENLQDSFEQTLQEQIPL